jgi:hypothetical protein
VTLDGDHSYPVDALSYLLEAFRHHEVDFLNASRFPVRDRQAMSLKHHFGNLMLSLAMSILYFRWVRDSQSGMWVFRRSILKDMQLESDGMAFSEEIKIEALKNPRVRFGEISIMYSSRVGEKKLNPWRDGLHNLLFLIKKRLPYSNRYPLTEFGVTRVIINSRCLPSSWPWKNTGRSSAWSFSDMECCSGVTNIQTLAR